ncbi:class I SAM-dependent methyltransferase [Nitrosospira briensis]|uniref:class I SAM-dependent methyltransferase n=1 Tax=Nitrosospira briensis TaxID=35799 RepID=UPI0008EC212A|nr:class I SAM-dependent methyltransferase [Nitrosospira briensis]SFO39701.1 Methyltransferase domain-containing protein [Nitrosospira briensis]
MINPVLTPDYVFDIALNVWVRAEYGGISYSDGKEVEERIAGIINNAEDLTTLSAELASHCTDWPTTYHLSRKRANLLRPFEDQLRGKSVLEIGAGCGAITRYLGETGMEVLALEGSLSRASIAASRCRDLANVKVVAEAFDHFKPLSQFDVVTFIGVLEYARKFFPGNGVDPVDAMLAMAKSLLVPGGKLIIAIENQLGLKYFAGFPEDHTGKPMFGIEEHYSKDGVVTFGRKELGRRVNRTGLSAQQWWYPFPDYKLPSLMVSEAGALPQDDIDLIVVVRSACITDPQTPQSISFNQGRAWPTVIRNSLLGEMANSFVLLASDASFSQQCPPLAVHYAADRLPEFAKKVVFKRATDGTVIAHQIALYPSAKPNGNSRLKQRLVDQPFVKGELWQDRLLEIMTSPDWTAEQIHEWMKVWFDAFCSLAGITDRRNITDRRVSGNYLDAIPRNMLIDRSGAPIFIDQEWTLVDDLSIGHLSFRALLASFSSIGTVAKPRDNAQLRVLPLITHVMHCVNIDLNEWRMKNYLQLEAQLDRLATGKQTYTGEALVTWLASLELRMFDTQTPVHEKLARRDEQLAAVNQALAQRDKQLAMVRQDLARREEQLGDILGSTSWRITRPLRAIKSALAVIGKHVNREG